MLFYEFIRSLRLMCVQNFLFSLYLWTNLSQKYLIPILILLLGNQIDFGKPLLLETPHYPPN